MVICKRMLFAAADGQLASAALVLRAAHRPSASGAVLDKLRWTVLGTATATGAVQPMHHVPRVSRLAVSDVLAIGALGVNYGLTRKHASNEQGPTPGLTDWRQRTPRLVKVGADIASAGA